MRARSIFDPLSSILEIANGAATAAQIVSDGITTVETVSINRRIKPSDGDSLSPREEGRPVAP
jgi:hypothetical protein